MTLLNSTAFLTPAPRRYAEEEIPGFGRVRLRSITERERAEWERSLFDAKGQIDTKRLADQKARLIALCIVDADGNRILSDLEAKRLPDTMDAAIADRVYELCRRHVNLDESGDALKNECSDSPAIEDGDSPSS